MEDSATDAGALDLAPPILRTTSITHAAQQHRHLWEHHQGTDGDTLPSGLTPILMPPPCHSGHQHEAPAVLTAQPFRKGGIMEMRREGGTRAGAPALQKTRIGSCQGTITIRR